MREDITDHVEWGSPEADRGARAEAYLDKKKEEYQVRLADAIQQAKESKEVKEKVTVAAVPLEAQTTFWNYLNDVKYVDFKPEELTKANTWLVTHNATYLIQKNNCGYFGVKKSDLGIPTLPKSTHEEVFFELKYGPIPNAILEQIVAFFREVMKKYNDAEAFVQVYWDKTEGRYIIHVPKQQISKASVRYDATENLNVKDPARYVFVYECHSHNSMGAFWSGTDNADEKELRIYGVFGQLHKDEYKCLHRFFVGEEQINLDPDHVFEAADTKKTYLVTHEKKQYLVPAEKLKLDEKPKYILTDAEGKEVYVPVESVVLHRTKVDFPEGWFGSINVPLPVVQKTVHTGSYVPNYPKKHTAAASYDRNAFLNNYNPDDFTVEPTDDAAYAETAEEISDHVSDLITLTNGFDDLGTTLMFIEELEASNCLYDLHKHMSDYLGQYPDESQHALS